MDAKTAYYNDKVKKWDDMLVFSPAPRARRNIILKLIKQVCKEGNSLHDIGCANGLLLNDIKNKFKYLVLSGSDISDNTLQNNRKIYPDISFYHIDIGKQINHQSQYDLITCAEVVEHVPNLNLAILNINNLLKPGGIAILTLPRAKKGKIYPLDKIVGHIHDFEDITIFKNTFLIKKEINWGFPFFNLYKYLINIKPDAINKSFGESNYSIFNKLVSQVIYFLFHFNLPFWGKQLFLVLEKKNDCSAREDASQ